MANYGGFLVNTAAIWRTALERLETSSIDTLTKTWLQDAHLSGDIATSQSKQDIHLTLQVSNARACDMVNTHWHYLLEEVLKDVTGQQIMLTVAHPTTSGISAEPTTSNGNREPLGHGVNTMSPSPGQNHTSSNEHFVNGPVQTPLPYLSGASLENWENEQHANMLMHNRLNSRYTFDAFIVGNSNRLAHAASLAVAEAPGESYNPLFLYGGVGLGKTHLLHAIGHQGVETGLAVLYVSSEQFTNEIVNAIRYRTTEEFRAKYRSVDILLVDDIQFIAGKESTEEEFFHTFNSLYEMSKQIVICSDRPPKAIVSLEERLRSRFEWGLIADIQPPDLETRMAILRVKSDLLDYYVPDEIISYIAGRVQTNIRELEGCLNRLMAYQQLHRADLTLDVARAAISSLGNDTREIRLNSQQIIQAVAEYYHISVEDMCSKQRDKYIVMPRQIAMYLIRQETQAPLIEIGQQFGGRDHSTVLHACEKIDRAIKIDSTLRNEIVAIREQLM
jgi:chromosomal replication initiator protein